MVTLSRITTRTGDQGTTGLGDGSRLPKHHALIQVIGSVDEAGSLLGVVRLEDLPAEIAAILPQVQNDLFDFGSDLACPPGTPHEEKIPRITAVQVQRLEAMVTDLANRLQPLRSFILPGGTRAAAMLHLARTVVRRAERDLCAAEAEQPDRPWNPHLLPYLNRLSDACFTWARWCNDEGRADVLWEPGRGRE